MAAMKQALRVFLMSSSHKAFIIHTYSTVSTTEALGAKEKMLGKPIVVYTDSDGIMGMLARTRLMDSGAGPI